MKIDKDSKQYKKAKDKGELHYKVIALMLQLREVEIMRKVWSELKKEKIVFVPIHDSVVVNYTELNKTKDIIKDIWSLMIDDRFSIRVKTKNNSNIKSICGLTMIIFVCSKYQIVTILSKE